VEDFPGKGPDDLRRIIRDLRQSITKLWSEEQQLRALLGADLLEAVEEIGRGERPPESVRLTEEESDRCSWLDEVEDERYLDERELMAAQAAFLELSGQYPPPWTHPATDDLRRQVRDRLRRPYLELYRELPPPRGEGFRVYGRYHRRARRWLAGLMELPPEDCDVDRLTWVGCRVALDRLDEHPVPRLAVVS
jgi:hypothetical protein